MEKLTADAYRAMANRSNNEAYESFERCDTDGFLSQWANQQMTSRYLNLAAVAENGWKREFHALFDLEGNLIAAKYLEVNDNYAYKGTTWKWGILENDDPRSRIVQWFKESSAQKPETQVKNNAKKGFYVGIVRVPVEVNRDYFTYRADGGFSRNVEIVDNGQGA